MQWAAVFNSSIAKFAARMDVTKQSDLGSFYRNLYKQTTGDQPSDAHSKEVNIKQEQEEASKRYLK